MNLHPRGTLKSRAEQRVRDQAIGQMLDDGHGYQCIGSAFDVARQRILQIARRHAVRCIGSGRKGSPRPHPSHHFPMGAVGAPC